MNARAQAPAPSKPRAFVDLERSGTRFVLKTPYIQDFIEEFKTRLPREAREWDPKQKLWCVHRDYWKLLRDMLTRHFGEDGIVYGKAADAALCEGLLDTIDDPNLESYIYLGVRSDAPECVIHAAYQALELAYCESAYLEALDWLKGTFRDSYPAAGLPALAGIRAAYIAICGQREIARVVPPGTCDAWDGSQRTVPAREFTVESVFQGPQQALDTMKARCSRWPGWVPPEERGVQLPDEDEEG